MTEWTYRAEGDGSTRGTSRRNPYCIIGLPGMRPSGAHAGMSNKANLTGAEAPNKANWPGAKAPNEPNFRVLGLKMRVGRKNKANLTLPALVVFWIRWNFQPRGFDLRMDMAI